MRRFFQSIKNTTLDNSSLASEHAELLKQLKDQERKLTEREQQLNNRSATVVRRELREKLLEVVGKVDRLKFSDETERRKTWVLGTFIALLVFLLCTSITFVVQDWRSGNANYWNVGRQIASSIAFVVTMGFFVKWLNSWASRSAEEEYREKQFELDINRASWLVELLGEAKAETGFEIPDELITRLSRNLFNHSEAKEETVSAADALASAVLGSAAKARLAIPGAGEFEISRQGLNSLKRQNIPNTNE